MLRLGTCRFELGTLTNATRYINQFTEIFTEEGRKNVKITHKVPNQPPRVSFTPGMRATLTQQQQLQQQLAAQQQAGGAASPSSAALLHQKKPQVAAPPQLQVRPAAAALLSSTLAPYNLVQSMILY